MPPFRAVLNGPRPHGAVLTTHRIAAFTPPAPYRGFAVRSEELRHAWLARAPYGCVHVVRTACLNAAAQQALCALGRSRMKVAAFGDVDYAAVTLDELATCAPGQAAGRAPGHAPGHEPGVTDLVAGIAAALQATGVMGDDPAGYRSRVAARIDFLGSCGAGFHNDVRDHWTACLFWNLTLAAHDIEFVMPHAGLRIALVPGDLLVFDPAMAHGLCRPQDQGQAVASSFGPGRDQSQIFLSGELPLSDAQWAAAGAPWLPVEEHNARQALELMAAEFDVHTGAVKRPAALARCLLRSTCYVDEAAFSGK